MGAGSLLGNQSHGFHMREDAFSWPYADPAIPPGGVLFFLDSTIAPTISAEAGAIRTWLGLAWLFCYCLGLPCLVLSNFRHLLHCYLAGTQIVLAFFLLTLVLCTFLLTSGL